MSGAPEVAARPAIVVEGAAPKPEDLVSDRPILPPHRVRQG